MRTPSDDLHLILEVARHLEISEEQAADLVAQIRVHGWEWTPSETRGSRFRTAWT